MKKKNKKLGDLLVDSGFITKEQLDEALRLQKNSGEKLEEILVKQKLVSEKQIIEVLEFQLGIPHVVLDNYYIEREIVRLINENLARRHTLIPIKKENGKLIVAMADPLNIFAIDDIKIATGLEVEPLVATKNDILNAITLYYEKESTERALEEFRQNFNIDDVDGLEEKSLNHINNAPVVKLVNSIIRQAIKLKASDIHIEPTEKNLRIRLRIDGDLQEIMNLVKTSHPAISTRIKIMGKMDIAEKRLPQDGRVETNLDGKDIDMRISVFPTVYGEKIVVRLLDRSAVVLNKRELGFTEENLKVFDKIIQNPNGIVLLAGPTGSGKTTTLYTILKELNRVDKNIITIEDPVEYRLDGINQSQVNVKAGFTFANGLRAILRQDPDIIMIGEIRDVETAKIAVRAAITGHLVLSTLHTNDTASTITRLLDMDIEPFLISSSLVGIIAQRLVKIICPNCKISYIASEEEKKLLNLNFKDNLKLYRGKGCNFCSHTGYKGRTSIHEIMPINNKIKSFISNQQSVEIFKKAAIEDGMITLRENAIYLALKGVTTIEELIKVTYSID